MRVAIRLTSAMFIAVARKKAAGVNDTGRPISSIKKLADLAAYY